MAYIQETRWKGSGCKFFGDKGKGYKLFIWMGVKTKSDGAGILVVLREMDGQCC